MTAGTYYVVEDCPTGWIQTFPNTDKDTATCDYYTINVTSGFNELDNDFGNFKLGTKAGMKFDDVNGNGAKDAGDPGISNWTITLWTENGKATGLQTSGDNADGSKSVKTDADWQVLVRVADRGHVLRGRGLPDRVDPDVPEHRQGHCDV